MNKNFNFGHFKIRSKPQTMKKQFSILAFVFTLMLGGYASFAQDTDTTKTATPAEQPAAAEAVAVDATVADAAEEQSFHQLLKEKFIEGGAPFMWPILICLILGLAISIERIIVLNLATTNTKKLLTQIEEALQKGGVEAAKNVTKNTKVPWCWWTTGWLGSSSRMSESGRVRVAAPVSRRSRTGRSVRSS